MSPANKVAVIGILIVMLFGSGMYFMHGNSIKVNDDFKVWISNSTLYYGNSTHQKILDKNVMWERHVSEGGKIYLLYATQSREINTYFREYNGNWSKKEYVGGSYANWYISNKGVFVSSSINHRPWLYYEENGTWKGIKISDKESTTTAVYYDGKVIVAWNSRNNLFIAYVEKGKISPPEEVEKGYFPIRNISIFSHGISVKEESEDSWIFKNYTTMDYTDWQIISEKVEPKKKTYHTINREFATFHRRAVAKWTFMVYMDADNNLNSSSYGDIDEMENGYKASASGEVNVIVLWDRNGNGDSKLIKIKSGGYDDISSSAPWMSSEVDMGDPQTLEEFVEWTVKNYPAEYYFLDLWDHGGDYSGAMWDDTSGTHLSLEDLKEAADNIKENIGRSIDIWGYDACLMDAGADNYQIKEAANIIVASEHTEGSDGWDYNAILTNLTENYNQNPEQFAYSFVEHVDDENDHQCVVTMAAINVTRWDYRFMEAYNELAQAIRKDAGTENSEIRAAFNDTVSADSQYWSNGKDVGDFAKQLLSHVNNTLVRYWANRLIENVSYSVINFYDYDTSSRKIIMAETDSESQVDSSFYIFKETEWGEMLHQVYTLKTNDDDEAPSCSIESPVNNSSFPETATIKISGNASDPDGSVQEVEVKIDRGNWIPANGTASWNYTLDLSNLSLGQHHIFARAYDGNLYSLYASIVINVIQRTDLPDLVINSSDIHLSNTTPEEGKMINISATVYNTGNNNSYNVNVSFYVDKIDEEHMIRTVNYGNITEGEYVTKNISWSTSGYAGKHRIYVYADSTKSIAELNESNNIAWKNITVMGYAINMSCKDNQSEISRGNVARYEIFVNNTGTYEDTYDLEITAPENWSAELTSYSVTLQPYSGTMVYLYVKSPENAVSGERADITVTGISEGNSSKSAKIVTTTTIRPPILLVDDDGGANFQEYFEDALNGGGYKYDVWNVSLNGSPSFEELENYEIVIWETGAEYRNTLTSGDQKNLTYFLKTGGRLYLSSQDVLWDLTNGVNGYINNEFIKEYLQVTYVNNDVGYSQVSGVKNDPISGDFSLINLTYPQGITNYDDEINVSSSAVIIFKNSSSGNATASRYNSGVFRTVFTAFSFVAVENNNNTTGSLLMNNIISWLMVSGDNAPLTPSAPDGPDEGETGVWYRYTTNTIDPDNDTVAYIFNWGDGNVSVTPYVPSGKTVNLAHKWLKPGTYMVNVRAIDSRGAISPVSDSLEVTVKSNTTVTLLTPLNNSEAKGEVNITGLASDPISGNFDEIWNMNYGSAVLHGAQAIGDVTNDGKNDLLIGGDDGVISVFEWNGTNFSEIGNITDPSGKGDNPEGYAIGDLNGDGIKDIAVAWKYDFSAFEWNGSAFRIIGDIWGKNTSFNFTGCAIGNIDGNGINEVVLSLKTLNGTSEIIVLYLVNNTWKEKAEWKDPYENQSAPEVSVADLYGNGIDEIIATPGNQAVVLQWNNNSLVAHYICKNFPENASGIAVGNFDGKSNDEIAIGLDSPEIYVFRWNGSAYQEIYNKTWSNESPVLTAIAAADINFDGITDLIVGTNFIHVLEWNGTRFKELYTLNATDMGTLSAVYAGDLTNNGKEEIVAGNVQPDNNSEFHVRVFQYHDAISKVEISIDDPSFENPIKVNGTNRWYVVYNLSSLGGGYHRIYVRAFNGYTYVVRYYVVYVPEEVPEFTSSATLFLLIFIFMLFIRRGRRIF